MQQENGLKTYRLLYIPILFLFSLSFIDCAKKGSPSGGIRDTIAPVILRAAPENFTTNFEDNEIRITFDEFIKLKDINKELIISPPLKFQPEITPLSISKMLKIKILDTLRENTTYSFNFGNSILDNNEGNIFPNYKYVLSTGSFIDSLTLKGTIIDAVLPEHQHPTTVALYEVSPTYTDSLVFNEKPMYITTTIAETNAFELTNLKAGTYQLIALKETNSNYTFEPNTDKIGFYKDLITLPTDSTYQVKLFKEEPDFKTTRPKLESKNRISFGYVGKADSLAIKLLTPMDPDFSYQILKEPGKDTLNFWFKPEVTKDSLVFITQNKQQIDTATVRFRKLFADSLRITPVNSGRASLVDTIKLTANTPLIASNKDKIKIIDQDSVSVPFTLNLNKETNATQILFEKKEEQTYGFSIDKGAFEDFFGNVNDSIGFRQVIQPESDYASLALSLENANEFPLIVELINDKFTLIQSTYILQNEPVLFKYLKPGNYYIRLIYDTNGNKKWDSGNFLKKIAPEKIVYYPSKIELRPNWSWSETFTLN